MRRMNSPLAPCIYVVDDDTELRALLQGYLGKQGLDVLALASADELLRRLPRRRPDLVVMDLMMPGTTGLEALRKLRAEGDDLPLILLTARSDDVDRIVGLELGADDYLGKPFNPRELLARIQAVLRRRGTAPAGAPQAGGGSLRFGAYELDLATRTLSSEGRCVRLSTGEFALLRSFAAHPYKPLSRERLLELAHGADAELQERAIDVQVLRLRRLIEADPQNPTIIQTVRGVGYIFVPRTE
jgi:two-component system phosphate regulon response regulator OmpR